MKTLCAGLLVGLASTWVAPAYVFIDASLIQAGNHFGAAGTSSYAFFNLTIDDGDGIVDAHLSSPSGSITANMFSASSGGFSTFSDLVDEIHSGAWTLSMERYVSEEETEQLEYEFYVDVSGVSLPDPFFILNPASGATDVPSGATLFEWTIPAGVYDSQGVDLALGAGSRSTQASIPIGPADSNWLLEAPGLQPNKTYLFFAQYTDELTGDPDVSISTPIDQFSNPLNDFEYSMRLNNEAETAFTTAVPEPGSWAAFSCIGLVGWMWVRERRKRGSSVR